MRECLGLKFATRHPGQESRQITVKDLKIYDIPVAQENPPRRWWAIYDPEDQIAKFSVRNWQQPTSLRPEGIGKFSKFTNGVADVSNTCLKASMTNSTVGDVYDDGVEIGGMPIEPDQGLVVLW